MWVETRTIVTKETRTIVTLDARRPKTSTIATREMCTIATRAGAGVWGRNDCGAARCARGGAKRARPLSYGVR